MSLEKTGCPVCGSLATIFYLQGIKSKKTAGKKFKFKCGKCDTLFNRIEDSFEQNKEVLME